MNDLGTPEHNPTPLLEDSKPAIKWSTDPASWLETRHIDTYFHKLREWVSSRIVKVEYCHTSVQKADIFTKALPTDQHRAMKQHVLGETCALRYDKFTRRSAPPAA